MSRKLHFFKDHIHKSALLPSALPTLQPDVNWLALEARGFLVSGKSYGIDHPESTSIMEQVLLFERMLFRATRGNLFSNQLPLDELVIDQGMMRWMTERMAASAGMDVPVFPGPGHHQDPQDPGGHA
ncbi:hypothetical protein E3N88_16177 [Mikania micrantha]|uniref:Uncharacterized protein n=1 Tax=Mikania micrantha TaxID=192012 RepID=A0A5N6NYY7_9ASTR|nr:hypothetical protein E3N88_16177 [Mikania micrantha]